MGCVSAKGGGASSKGGTLDRAQERKQAKTENKDYQARMQFLCVVPLFKRLPKDQQPLVASNCERQDFKSGETVIKMGEEGDEFFVIVSGEANVFGDGDQQVATLKKGDYFGEIALLRNELRTATIVAVGALQTFKISRAKFQELGLTEKLQFANRQAVGAGALRGAVAKPPSSKTPEERELITKALKNNENLQTMVSLDAKQVNSMIDVLWKETVEEGAEVIKEGDLDADYFYIVQEGDFEITMVDGEDTGADDVAPESPDTVPKVKSKVVTVVGAGGSFGELALLYLVPRAATVKAKSKAVLWVIDRFNFKAILMKVSDQKIDEYMKYLDDVQILNALLQNEKKELAKALVEMHFTQDEIVLQQGEFGNTFYILYDGSVDIVKDGKVVNSLTASVSNGTAQYFGEKALLDNETRNSTVKVTSSIAKALALDRGSFDMLLGSLKDIIQQGNARSSMAGTAKVCLTTPNIRNSLGIPKTVDPSRPKILRKELHRIGLLGCGGFGTVELFEHKSTGMTYALKRLSKGYVVKTGMQESVMNEKNILMMTNSPFITKLFETYNGQQSLYFLLEPCLGGELYATYNRKGLHGSERHAKFYTAGVVFAFEHLHERRIIYRDLKPENLLLTEKGQIKLTDMGLAKFVIGKTYTTCGTPDYFAPELIASSGHTNAVDWWTVGVLIFELMSGHPPFESAYPMQIYTKVMKGINKVTFPPRLAGPTSDLIKALLRNEPSERLPVRPGGIKNIQNHAWFKDFNWEAMKDMSSEPPYKPTVKSPKDLANFSSRQGEGPRQIDYTDDGSNWDKDFATAQ